MHCATRHPLHRAAPLLVVLTLAALVAGCAGVYSNSPSVEYRDGTGRERGLSGGTYTVQRGDTIYSVARQLNVSVRALIDANGLQPPFQLTVGQVLSLSAGGDYVVGSGDTLLGVSRKTGVSFSTLARMNGLTAPYVLKVGQRLKLPTGSSDGTATAAAAQVIESPRLAQAGAPVSAPPVAPPPPATATASAGGKPDGYTSLAEREAKPAAAPVAPAAVADASPTSSAATPSAPASTAAPSPAPGPVAAPTEQHVAAAAPAPLPAPPPKSGRGFVWPVHGDVIAEFGSSGKGQHNDGINIAVPRGTPVAAAEDGVVAYAGNELRGFGNLLLIKHAGGWMTAYAHNDALLVKRGDTVKRGQHIAKVGDSGGVSQPQLHFEVRQGTHAIDPMTVLSGGKPVPASSQGDQSDPG